MVAAVAAALNATPGAASTSPSKPIPMAELPYIFDIAVDRADPAYLFLATRSGVYRAAPDGTAVRVSVSGNSFWNLVPHPSLAKVLYAGGILERGENLGIIVSEDSGRTWRQAARKNEEPHFFRKIDVSKVDAKNLYGVGQDLWVSRDGGDTWNRAHLPPARATDVLDIAASSQDANTIYGATLSGLMASTDGGRSWQEAFAKICQGPVTVVETAWDGMLYAFSMCGGLLKANERTGDWTIVKTDFGGCIIQHLTIDPRDSKRVYVVLRCNYVLASNDGGRTWLAFGSKEATVPSCPSNPHGRSWPGTFEAASDRDEVKDVTSLTKLPMLE